MHRGNKNRIDSTDNEVTRTYHTQLQFHFRVPTPMHVYKNLGNIRAFDTWKGLATDSMLPILVRGICGDGLANSLVYIPPGEQRTLKSGAPGEPETSQSQNIHLFYHIYP